MRTMILRSLKFAVFSALLAGPAIMSAQNELSASEEQRLEALAREQAEVYLPRNSVTVGFRVLSSGAKVNFSKLGSVDFNHPIAPLTAGAIARSYDNGQVLTDAQRPEETARPETVTTTNSRVTTTTTQLPQGRYEVTVVRTNGGADGKLDPPDDATPDDVTTTSTKNMLSYAAGLTRSWSYVAPEQAALRPGFIALSSYSAVSAGAAMEHKQGPVGGIELQFARILGKSSGRIQWSLITGISLNGINNKTAGDIQSTLHSITDLYSLNGLPAPTAPYNAPSNPSRVLETTVPIGSAPVERLDNPDAGPVTVHGRWQVKGAYFLVKVGPAMRTQLSERLGLSASLGFAGAYSGTNYSAAESFETPIIGRFVSTPRTEQSDVSKFLSGYYADLNLEFAANGTTGLFGGVTAQKLGNYDQMVGSRIARIDLGTSVGIRGGISIRF